MFWQKTNHQILDIKKLKEKEKKTLIPIFGCIRKFQEKHSGPRPTTAFLLLANFS
jgi:hypothetical protein